MKITSTFALLALATSSTTFAFDVWVDPVNGDDANPGTAMLPFRTITRAVSRSGVTVFLSQGDYSAASGEVFPIQLEDGDALVARAGRDLTRVLLPADNGAAVAGIEFDGEVSIDGLTMEQPGTDALALGVSVPQEFQQTELRVRDSRLVGGATGIEAGAYSVFFERTEFVGQADQAVMVRGGNFELVDVVIRDVNRGLNIEQDDFTVSETIVERSSFLNVTTEAIRVRNQHFHGIALHFTIRDCLLAGHGTGIAEALGSFEILDATVEGCTFVSDRGVGIDADVEFMGCIIAGHPGGDVIDAFRLTNCLVEDGSFFPSGGMNIRNADPLFVDRAAGDFRLGWGSPAIDTGLSPSGRDRLDHPRTVDGDLQLIAGPDMGALEHQTLSGPQAVSLGQPIPLEVTGPSGGFTTVVVSPTGFAAQPATNPFGSFFLDPVAVFRLPSVPTFGVMPTAQVAPAFTDPALIGTQVGFQALTRSLGAPAGGAYSQPILVRIDA